MSLLLVVVSVFGAGSSALAYDGWADSLSTAHPTTGYVIERSYIDDSVDVDWFSWTNNTNTNVNVIGSVLSPSGKNYDITLVVFFGSTPISFPAADKGPGAYDSVSYGTVAPGQTVYFQIRGRTTSEYSSTDQYLFTVNY
jgi:hypothetical protein